MRRVNMDNGEDDEHDYDGRPRRRGLQCSNCGAPCRDDGDHCCYTLRLCHGCAAKRQCRRCQRHLPDVCFADAVQDTCEVSCLIASFVCLHILFYSTDATTIENHGRYWTYITTAVLQQQAVMCNNCGLWACGDDVAVESHFDPNAYTSFVFKRTIYNAHSQSMHAVSLPLQAYWTSNSDNYKHKAQLPYDAITYIHVTLT